MSADPPEFKPVKTLGMHVRKALREAHVRRPTSFYLLLATPPVLLLGLHMVRLRETPVQMALVLSAIFLFFGFIILRAILDVLKISRKHLSERKSSFRETLGDPEFLDELGNRVKEKRDE
jgi:hypothetical protein